MPVLINEVLAEVEPTVIRESEAEPLQERSPLEESEFEFAQMLAIVEERRQRLLVD